MNHPATSKRNTRLERHVLAAVGTGGKHADVVARVSNRLTSGERDTALARLEAAGAITRDHNGHLTRDLQAWATMRRNQK